MQEEGEHERNTLPVYESYPPPWLPQSHLSADLGYSGFHPPRPGQGEDVMSQANVKGGFIVGDCVPAETFSAQEMIQARFSHPDALSELEELMNEIFTRRADQAPPIPAANFRMPSRVTLNEAKRQAWFADLANPEVPLHKLGKNVPHGAKGHDLLDLLHFHNVAIPRAVWFLRVFGANETAGLRNRPNYIPTQYSTDWATVVTGYMKKQLADIALPSAPRAGMNIKQTFKGVLADSDSRERWISRFGYCLRLLRTFYAQGLVDNRALLTWLVQTMASCNLAQAGFVARLADEYLDGMLGSRALAKPFVDACLSKLVEIRTTAAYEYLPNLDTLLKILLQRICIELPDAFVSTQTWITHSDLLAEILAGAAQPPPQDECDAPPQIAEEVQRVLTQSYLDVKLRSEAMLFRTLPPRVLAHLGSTVKDIQLLNSITHTTQLDALPFFDALPLPAPPAFAHKLNTLLTWSVAPLQFGDHRAYAAAALLRRWRDRSERRAFACAPAFLQDQLFEWLDESGAAGREGGGRSVARVFGRLAREGLFGYAEYMQRLVARGEQGLSDAQEPGSRHRPFLRCIPLHGASSALVGQRKVILYGARARETPEDLNARGIRKEIRAVAPALFGGELRSTHLSTRALLEECATLGTASRCEQVQTFRHWLMPLVRKAVDSQTLSGANLLQVYCIVVELMTQTKCYGSVLELTLCILSHASTPDLMTAVIETLRRHLTIWTCMRSAGTVTAALYTAHQVARTQGIQSRDLLNLLVEIDNGRHLDAAAREHVLLDIAALTHALRPDSEAPGQVPPVLPEILLLAEDINPDAPSILANSLWYKYRTAFDWGWKVWDNTVASIRQVPVMRFDTAGRQACALCYGRFLLHVDQHLPGGIDEQVLEWFGGTGQREVPALSPEAWDVLIYVLLYLAVHDALSATTVLRGLIYPAWQTAASATSEPQGQAIAVHLTAANDLFSRLVLSEEGSKDGVAPTDFIEVQRLRTRRKMIYREPHFSLLITNIPTLVIVENNAFISEDLRHACGVHRKAVCATDDFRQKAHRNLDDVRNAFEQPLLADGVADELSDLLVDALRLILSEDPSEIPDVAERNWHSVPSLLSPWRLEATAIQLQFTLRQMGRQMAQKSTAQNASDRLDKLTGALFHHSMSSEEAYFVAEMASGVDVAVAAKFINNGLQCISAMLKGASTPIQLSNLEDCVRRGSQLLRVLVHVAGSMQEEAISLPQVKPSTQDDFIAVVCALFAGIETMLAVDEVFETAGISESLIFLLRLLQFDLGLTGVWTPKTKELSGKLVSTLFKLSTTLGSGNHINLTIYPLIVDTLYYLIDEIPIDTKSPTFNPFRNYPDAAPASLPLSMPLQHRNQLCSLLPRIPQNATVVNLVTAHRDASSGRLVFGDAVCNRPWEWIENLGEPSFAGADGKTKDNIRNSASIPLDLFAARTSGDVVIHNGTDDPRIEANIRSFEDGLSAESVFKRDWRETRTDLVGEDGGPLPSSLIGSGVNRAEEVDEVTGLPSFAPRPSRQSSPAHSQKSNRPSVDPSPARASPHHSQPATSMSKSVGSSAAEPIVIDMPGDAAVSTMSGTRASKRKLTISDSDDDIEIIENPAPAASTGNTGSRAGKKPKGKTLPAGKTTAKTTAKTRSKKR